MIQNWRRLLGRMACGLGLMLAAQLASSAGICTSAMGMAEPCIVQQQRCLNTSAAPASCIAAAQRIDAAAPALPPSPDLPASADAPRHARAISVAAAEPRLPAGLAPGSPPPLYILFRRYLS